MTAQIKAIETTYKGYRFRGGELPAEPQKRISSRADHTGVRFGRLRAAECLGLAGEGYRWWGCICDCGSRIAVRSRELLRGHTSSCGCLSKETLGRAGGRNKLPEGRAAANELLASYKKSAQGRGHLWGLDASSFFTLVSSPCAYCGVTPNKMRKPNKGVNGGFWYTGVDRVDPTSGYFLGNVVSCCWDCNRAKGSLTASQFNVWIDRLTAFRAGALA